MWQGFLQTRWKDQCNDQDARNQNEKKSKKWTILLQKTAQLYNQQEHLDTEDWRMYHKPVTECWKETNNKIKEWIKLASHSQKLTRKITRKPKVDHDSLLNEVNSQCSGMKQFQRTQEGHLTRTKMRSKVQEIPKNLSCCPRAWAAAVSHEMPRSGLITESSKNTDFNASWEWWPRLRCCIYRPTLCAARMVCSPVVAVRARACIRIIFYVFNLTIRR